MRWPEGPVPEVARRLRELAQDGTALVVVDDAHLADPSSALVLRDALRTRGPLLMVLAARAAELADNAELQAVLDDPGGLQTRKRPPGAYPKWP